jgi:hypothetical protein
MCARKSRRWCRRETWVSLTLEGFEKKVEVNGREYTVKVLGWSAELRRAKAANSS